MKFDIRTIEDCDDLEALAFLILSTVGAKRRWLRWETEAPLLCGVKRKQAQMRAQMAMAKTFEEAEHYQMKFEILKARKEGCR